MEKKLYKVDPNLIKLLNEVKKISPISFVVTYGLRSDEEQNKLYKQGKSKCDGYIKKSKHQLQKDGFCKAIDICPCINGKVDFKAVNDLCIIIGLFIAKAKELNIKIRVGALWEYSSTKNNTFLDAYHIELI